MRGKTYRVVGNKRKGYAVVFVTGGVEYDLIDTRQEAEGICDILNRNIGPEWDAVEPLLFAEMRGGM